MNSVRQEKLTQDALDVLAWAFTQYPPIMVHGLMPLNAVEVEIGGDEVNKILYGGDGFRMHGGGDSPRYFRHADDEQWAVVFADECTGDSGRGAEIVADQ